MVESVTENVLSSKANQEAKALIVDLVGLAGAGKTTLAQAMSACDGRVQVAADLELRRMDHMPIFVRNAPSLLPVLLRRCRDSRWFSWDEIKAMVYLEGWPRVLRQKAMHGGTAILLDHGPVFKLATLNAFGPERLKSRGFETWWHSMFEQWASTLDIVIWLNASDSILVDRINARNRRHAIKGKSEREAHKFLLRYQTSYEQILAKLTAYGQRLTLLHFDTSQKSPEQIAVEVLKAMNKRHQKT